MKKLKELPKFNSEDEEREFWASHSFLDYYNIDSFKRVPPPMTRKDEILFKMLADMTPDVQRLSREKKTTVEEMVRQLVAAGLETARRGGLHPGA